MTTESRYSARLAHEADGRIHVYFRDLPEAITSGGTRAEALGEAEDVLEVAVSGRMADGLDLPEPSRLRPDESLVLLPTRLAAKALVYRAWKKAGLTKTALAQRMGRSETEIRRILAPRHGTRLEHLDEAARALGIRLVVAARAA
jgi:antitoxin HicB